MRPAADIRPPSEPISDAVAKRAGDIGVAQIESLTHDARGVARIDGKTTFIEGALPGEQVRFRYHNKLPRYDTGAMLEAIVPSPDRTEPPCRYYGVCGGCSLQHLAAPAQRVAKQRVVAETLEHLGRVQPVRWLPPLHGPTAGYRRRARLGVRFVPKKGGVLVGFRERRHSYIAPLDECLTLDARLSALLPGLRDCIGKLSRSDRIPQVEVAAGDDRCAVVFRHFDPLQTADVAHLRAFGERHDVSVYVQPGRPDTVRPLWPLPVPPLSYTLPAFDVRLIFEPIDFVQVNAEVNRQLVQQAITLLDIGPTDRVLDLFCGLGNFTLAAARRGGRVVGCEGEAGLVERARANARLNRIENAEFRVADLYQADGLRALASERYDKLLLDPPRAGAIEVIKALPADGPARIVYIGCNPATLARDSDTLVHGLGYRLEAAGIADMFPHTSHIESIALFVRP